MRALLKRTAQRWPRMLVAVVGLYGAYFLGHLAWHGQYYELRGMVALVGIYAILAMSLNVICGMTGLLQLGHAGFFAIGAYTAALISLYATAPQLGSANLVLSGGAAMVVAALFSLLIGFPCLRLRGDYLAIATLGFGEIVKQLLDNLYVRVDAWGVLREYFKVEAGYDAGAPVDEPILIGGPTGLEFPQEPGLAGGLWEDCPDYSAGYATWWVIWILVLMSYVFFRNIKRSRIGRALLCVREDEIAAQAMGINVPGYKMLSFLLSAGFAGLAGALFYHNQLTVAPSDFQLLRSIEVLLMVVLGGLGSFSGALCAAVMLGLTPDILRRIDLSGMSWLPESVQAVKPGEYQAILYALLLIVLIRLAPNGLLGLEELPFGLGRRRGPGKEPDAGA